MAKPKALIYARVSSARQKNEGSGLESQEHRCREYAEQRGYKVEEVFLDDASGGGDFMKRPAMVRLLNYLDAHTENEYIIIFDDLKRFARDTIFHLMLRKEMEIRKAKLECLNFKFEDTEEGEFIETILAAQGQLERKQNRRQVMQKMKARLERGYWCFNPPPGLKSIKDKVHGKLLTADEPMASIITQVLEGFANNIFLEQVDVKRFLESKELGYISLDKVKRMLTCPLYAGYVEYPEWEVSRRRGHHKGFISLDTYEKIQKKLNAKVKTYDRKDENEDFPARRNVFCPLCDKPFTAAWTTKNNGTYRRAYYRCKTLACPMVNKTVAKDVLEGDIEKLLSKINPSEEILDLAREVILDVWKTKLASVGEEDRQKEKAIQALDFEIQRYVSLVVETSNAAVRKAYEDKIEGLTTDKLVLQDKKTSSDQYTEIKLETAIDTVFDFLKNPADKWKNGTFQEQRLVLKMVFSKPLVYHLKEGLETVDFSLPCELFELAKDDKNHLVEMAGVKPASKTNVSKPYSQD